MKPFKQETHIATDTLQRIFTVLMIILIFAVLYIGLAFYKKANTFEVHEIETVPVLTINTVIEPTIQPKQPKYLDIPLSHELQDYIESEVKNYPFVTKELAYAVMKKESEFNQNAVGGQGEVGLMQIHPINFGWLSEDYGLTNLHDPYQNIKSGLIMLNYLIGKQNDIEMGLIAFNCGESKADSLFGQGIFSTEYSREVVKIAEGVELIDK